MRRTKVKPVKLSRAELAHDTRAESDFTKLEFVGRGVDAMKRDAKRRLSSIQLDKDVAAVFKDSESVNKVLRAVIGSWPVSLKKSRRKSA